MPALSRPNRVEVDLDAIRNNVAIVRKLVAGRRIYGCVKADAYGCGLRPVSRELVEGGVDALAVADPRDALELRKAGFTLPILLYASTLPEQANDVADLDVIVTVHDFLSLHAFSQVKKRLDVFLKIECGAGRYGFMEAQWAEAFRLVQASRNLAVRGIYAHPVKPEDKDITRMQGCVIARAFDAAASCGLSGFERLVASSRFVLGHPDLYHTAVDPGRLLLGHLPREWVGIVDSKPAVKAIKSRITQVQEYPREATYGFVPDGRRTGSCRGAIAPIGFADGFPASKGSEVLVCGRRARLLSLPRGIESIVFDVTEIPEAQVGTEVVLLGSQEDQTISATDLAEALECSVFEIMFRLSRNANRVYFRNGEEVASIREREE